MAAWAFVLFLMTPSGPDWVVVDEFKSPTECVAAATQSAKRNHKGRVFYMGATCFKYYRI